VFVEKKGKTVMSGRPENFADILNRTCRWPKKGDRLLPKSIDWDRGIKFSNDQISRHVFLWQGYMRAAATLIEASKGYRAERQMIIYPILFNYRHGIELAMKWVITMYGGISIEKIEHHDLWQLWKICRQIIPSLGTNDEAIQAVEQVIKDLHDLDGNALKFRYSCDKNGVLPSLPDGLINLEHIRDVMEAVGNFFEGADGQLGASL
jgi:hypothetical protein